LSDGTESLGDPAWLGAPLALGSGVVAAGTGLNDPMNCGCGQIDITVPGTVKQVLLYWMGGDVNLEPCDAWLTVNSAIVMGTQIGGPAYFFDWPAGSPWHFCTFAADVTAFGFVSPGANTLTIQTDSVGGREGASVVVIYDDGSSTAELQLRDGIDLAYLGFPGDRQVTVPQTFTFAPSAVARTASLTVICGSVGEDRGTIVRVTSGGSETTLVDALYAADGDTWDTLAVPVTVAAGVTDLTVGIESVGPLEPVPGRAASLGWVCAALSVPESPQSNGDGAGTPGYWKNHPDAWPVDVIVIGGVPYTKDEAIERMMTSVRGDKTLTMFAALVCAELNVLIGNPSECIADTMAAAQAWMAAYPVGSGVEGSSPAWAEGEPLYLLLDSYNNGELCAPARE
jgi:hypothetical protein